MDDYSWDLLCGNKTGSELRDAWNKLYGGQVRPESRGPTSYPPEPQLRPDSLNVHKNFPHVSICTTLVIPDSEK
jgi:hypothetical protein